MSRALGRDAHQAAALQHRLGPSVAQSKSMLGHQRLVEVLHREIPVACPVLLDDELDLVHRRAPPRYPAAPPIDQPFRPLRLVAVAKTPKVPLADPQQRRRLPTTQSSRAIALQSLDIPRHPYLGSHPDLPAWNSSKNRTDRLLPGPDISSATDTIDTPSLTREKVSVGLINGGSMSPAWVR